MTTLSAARPGPARLAPVAPPASPVRAHPQMVRALIVLGGLLSIALWWVDTLAVHGLGDWLTNAGRITGLLAGYGVVVLVALMARIPALDRGIGTDRLSRWHSAGGRYVVSLVVAHGLLIWWGYAVTTRASLTHEGADLLTTYPDVLAGTVAGLLLVGVGIVSARAARARLRYETWYYLHLYTYLAIALAFSHQFAVGADFMSNRAARVAWSALYLAVGVLLVWYRVLTPLRRTMRHQLRVVDVRPEGAGVVSVYLAGRHLDELGAEPGQFFRWRFLTRDMWWSANPYSLSAAPRPDMIRITAKALGDHSAALAGLRRGTRVIASGPYGAFTPARRRRRRVLLVAGGVGISPIRALLESLPARPGEVTLLYRASRAQDLVLRREIDAIAGARGVRVHYLVGRRSDLGRDPLSAGALRALVPDLSAHDVFLCGPAGMTEATRDALVACGVPRGHIYDESFEF